MRVGELGGQALDLPRAGDRGNCYKPYVGS